ncbi:MAG: hypothetical protein ACYC56_03415 [Candidatus Aquicultor sp.]
MMKRYNLHPVGEPQIWDKQVAQVVFSKQFSELFDTASKQVGLDLGKSRGKQLTVFYYTLKEQCQSNERTVTASFLCDKKGSLTGAFLSLAGYMPGVVSLKERYAFYPDGLTRDPLHFTGLNRIEIAGWHGEHGWEASATLSRPEDIKHFVSLLEKSVGHKGTYEGASIGQEEYRIFLYYNDGVQLGIWFAPREQRDEIGIDAFQGWHYYPPEELKIELRKLLPHKQT